MKESNSITYQKIYWLFLAESLIGLVLEGFWCLVKHGHWESHVNLKMTILWGILGIIFSTILPAVENVFEKNAG